MDSCYIAPCTPEFSENTHTPGIIVTSVLTGCVRYIMIVTVISQRRRVAVSVYPIPTIFVNDFGQPVVLHATRDGDISIIRIQIAQREVGIDEEIRMTFTHVCLIRIRSCPSYFKGTPLIVERLKLGLERDEPILIALILQVDDDDAGMRTSVA